MIYSLIIMLCHLAYPGSATNSAFIPVIETEKTFQDSSEVEIKMEIHGLYEGRNLFISNPIKTNGEYCITTAPELNGSPTAKVVQANSLEIKLDEYGLELGDVIKIIIWHSPDCKPVLINPEVIDPSN